MPQAFYLMLLIFQSTPPVKAATAFVMLLLVCFIFQSTPPVKAATIEVSSSWFVSLFQSTPPVKAATFSDELYDCGYVISIHAAREGGDFNTAAAAGRRNISIHAAREGGDPPDGV